MRVFYILYLVTCCYAILKGPENTAVFAGDDVVLTCSTDNIVSTLVWSELTTAEERFLVVDGIVQTTHPWAAEISVESNNLIIPAAAYKHAGRYKCSDFLAYAGDANHSLTNYNASRDTRAYASDTDSVAYAELIVVKEFYCSLSQSADSVLVENIRENIGCTAAYSGLWGPQLIWKEGEQSLPGNGIDKDGYVREIASLNPVAEQDGTTFVCDLYFLAPPLEVLPPSPEHNFFTPVLKAECLLNVTVLYTARIQNITGYTPGADYQEGDVFQCLATGNPDPNITWQLEVGMGPLEVFGETLTVDDTMEGETIYTCYANNWVQEDIIGLDNRTITFVVPSPTEEPCVTDDGDDEDEDEVSTSDNVGTIIGAVFGAVIFIVLVILGAYMWVRRNNLGGLAVPAKPMRKWSKSQRRSSQDLIELSMEHPLPLSARNSNHYEMSGSTRGQLLDSGAGTTADENVRPGIEGWEIDRNNVELDKILGEGHFALVYKARVKGLPATGGGTVNHSPHGTIRSQGSVSSLIHDTLKTKVVAIKTLKPNASDKDKQDMFNELEVMRTLPKHENVVQLVGCCTTRDPIYVMVQYVANGNLKDFLRLQRNTHTYGNLESAEGEVGAKELMNFALQIAKGMAHIAQHSLLHRDLAARNILVTKHRVCKVSDFGLSRDVIDRNEYQRESSGPLPIRWMAPESIFDNIYTTKSDVWSYGILLWEIVTLGASPYPGMSPKQVIHSVRDGYRMEKPEHCTDEIHSIMRKCWINEASERPDFPAIVEELDSLLLAESDYLALELYQEDVYGDLQPTDEEKV